MTPDPFTAEDEARLRQWINDEAGYMYAAEAGAMLRALTTLRELRERDARFRRSLEQLQNGPDTLTPDGLRIVLTALHPDAERCEVCGSFDPAVKLRPLGIAYSPYPCLGDFHNPAPTPPVGEERCSGCGSDDPTQCMCSAWPVGHPHPLHDSFARDYCCKDAFHHPAQSGSEGGGS